MAEEVTYIRVGISPKNDRLLEKIAAKGFIRALTKVDVGRLAIQYALAHWVDMLNWYRDRGQDIIVAEGGVDLGDD